MFPIIALILAILPLFILYATLNSYYQAWQYNRKAAKRGCKPAALRPYKIPGGIDQISRIFEADKRHQVPNEFEKIFLQDMAGKDTIRIYFFGKLLMGTINPENIQAMLAKQFEDFELGPTRRGQFWPILGNGIFTSDGAAWTHARAMLRPQFARNAISDLDMEERHLQDLLKHLPAKPTDSGRWTDKVNLQPLFFRLTLDSATEFLFGDSVHSQVYALPSGLAAIEKVENPTGLDLIDVGKAFDRAIHAAGVRGRFSDQYWLYNPKSFRDDCKLVHRFADFFVHRALHSDLEKGDQKKYVFLHELVKETRDPIELRSQLLNIFLAGRDTTAGLLGWIFWNLARHPDILAKLRASVLEDFGTYAQPKNITFATLKSCTYLQQVMNECLRMYPSVPLNSRRATKDTTLPFGGGPDGRSPVFIPKGTQVDYSVQCMHRRKDLWGEDAEVFKPSRWTGKKVGWEFLPFNGGPRICLGQQFALTEAGYVTVRLLQRYDRIENLSKTPESDPLYQYTVTTAPWEVEVRLREAQD